MSKMLIIKYQVDWKDEKLVCVTELNILAVQALTSLEVTILA